MELYIFNPDADLALAHGGENYIAPTSARLMASDLALLPIWYAGEGNAVLASSAYNDVFLQQMSALCSLDVKLVTLPELPAYADALLVPWGWNPSFRRFMLQNGVPSHRLPSLEDLQSYRRMASRLCVADCLEAYRELSFCCGESHNLTDLSSCRAYVESLPRSVLKAPWSGSGKGLCWCGESFSEAIRGWCSRVLREQGCVVASPVYEKMADFALEFYSDGQGEVTFQGYSLFRTNGRGAYQGNFLVSELQAETCLTRFLPLENLVQVRSVTTAVLQRHFSAYAGFLGVDMMVCRSGEAFFIHPFVEVNLRMNMGLLACCLQRRLLHAESVGCFFIEYYPSSDALRMNHVRDGIETPPVMCDGRLLSGYLPLVPVTPSSRYRAFVKAFPDKVCFHCHSGLWP